MNDLVIKLAILKYAQGRATIRFRIACYILVDICVADQLNSTQLNLYYSNCQTAVTVIYNIPKTPKYVKYMHFFGSPEAVSCDTGKYYLNSGDDPQTVGFCNVRIHSFIHATLAQYFCPSVCPSGGICRNIETYRRLFRYSPITSVSSQLKYFSNFGVLQYKKRVQKIEILRYSVNESCKIRYDTIEGFNVDSKAEYSVLSSTRIL